MMNPAAPVVDAAGQNPANVPLPVGQNAAAVPLPVAFPSPRVGGGNDATAWTGGPNNVLQRLAPPSSTMVRRPTGFKSANYIQPTDT